MFLCRQRLADRLEYRDKIARWAKTQFFLHFIKTKKISHLYGKLYADLFDWRQKGDYGDFFDFDKKNVEPILQPTKELMQIIKEIIGLLG